eukprot:c11344_g2_i2 orf=126-359(+)
MSLSMSFVTPVEVVWEQFCRNKDIGLCKTRTSGCLCKWEALRWWNLEMALTAKNFLWPRTSYGSTFALEMVALLNHS